MEEIPGQEIKEIPTPLMREVSLMTPPFPDRALIPETSLRECATAPNNLERVLQQRIQFKEARKVVVECNTIGLGDSIMSLRYGLALAKAIEDKEVVIRVPKPLTKLGYTSLPPNVAVEAGNIDYYVDEPGIFFMVFDIDHIFGRFAKRLMNYPYKQEEVVRKLRTLDSQYKLSYLNNSLIGHPSEIAEKLGMVTQAPYNDHDLIALIRMQSLGIDVTKDEIAEPILGFTAEEPFQYPQKYDLVIAPDAAETETSNYDRSKKSFSPARWREIFALMAQNPQQRIAVIKGRAHPKYTHQVFEASRQMGLNVTELNTPTFREFTTAVFQGKKFVGGDSGTTHLAAEVVKAAKYVGRDIQLREFYNEGIHFLERYAVSGLGENGRVLSYKPPYSKDHNKDIDSMPLKEAFNFITS